MAVVVVDQKVLTATAWAVPRGVRCASDQVMWPSVVSLAQ